MTLLAFENAVLADPDAPAPEPGRLLVEDGRIRGRLRAGEPTPESAVRIDLAGGWLAPGFVDVHFHGELAFPGADAAPRALERASQHLVRHGTTAFLPTTVSLPGRALQELVTRASIALTRSDWPGAIPLGLHLEGPWIGPLAAGAHARAAIRAVDLEEARELLAHAHGLVRMVTCAPEAPGIEALEAELARRGIVAALGHSAAPASLAEAAVARGVRHVTHLFNAMSPLHHRELGVAGVALTDDRVTCDLIADGAHVHPAVVRLAARAKGQRLLLISDRIDVPEERSEASFGSGALHADGVALRLADGRLAGSTLTLDRALRNVEAFGAMTRLDAIAACTLRPARLLGIEAERGTLRTGARADLVVLGPDGAVRETWIGGRRVFAEGSAPR